MGPVFASGIADATVSDFDSAVYNVFFGALVFGAGWLVVQCVRLTHKIRDVQDIVVELGLRLSKARMAEGPVLDIEEKADDREV